MIQYSVVIPMYNCESTIIDAVESVLNQTRYDLIDEIILVNDGSTDNSLDIINSYIEKNKISKVKIFTKENGGAASARNYGIKISKNDYIALLDSDDVWLKEKIEIQNEILIENPQIKALGSNRIGEIKHHGEKVKANIYKLSVVDYCIKNWPCTPSLIFDKRIFKDNKFFDENMTHAEEGIFFLDLAYLSGLYYVDNELVLCGNGKPAFGHSGLSGNLKKMHKGVLKMHNLAFKKKYISIFNYMFFNAYENLKFIRRIIIVNRKDSNK